jgi:hypothetical protein
MKSKKAAFAGASAIPKLGDDKKSGDLKGLGVGIAKLREGNGERERKIGNSV